MAEHEGTGDRGESVDGADGEIDTAGDDHERHADGHDGDEGRVFGELREILGVEKLVFLDRERHPFAGRIGGVNAGAGTVGSAFKNRSAHGAGEGGEEGAEGKDDEEQAAFLKTKERAKTGGHGEGAD